LPKIPVIFFYLIKICFIPVKKYSLLR